MTCLVTFCHISYHGKRPPPPLSVPSSVQSPPEPQVCVCVCVTPPLISVFPPKRTWSGRRSVPHIGLPSVSVHVCTPTTTTNTPTLPHPPPEPLPLSPGWLPRLQCRLSSSCCYETRTDRPELNDNASVALARGPQQPIRDGLDKHFPSQGLGGVLCVCACVLAEEGGVWVGRSLPRLRQSIKTIHLLAKMCHSLQTK